MDVKPTVSWKALALNGLLRSDLLLLLSAIRYESVTLIKTAFLLAVDSYLIYAAPSSLGQYYNAKQNVDHVSSLRLVG